MKGHKRCNRAVLDLMDTWNDKSYPGYERDKCTRARPCTDPEHDANDLGDDWLENDEIAP